MKVSQQTAAFSPISITLETAEELDLMERVLATAKARAVTHEVAEFARAVASTIADELYT